MKSSARLFQANGRSDARPGTLACLCSSLKHSSARPFTVVRPPSDIQISTWPPNKKLYHIASRGRLRTRAGSEEVSKTSTLETPLRGPAKPLGQTFSASTDDLTPDDDASRSTSATGSSWLQGNLCVSGCDRLSPCPSQFSLSHPHLSSATLFALVSYSVLRFFGVRILLFSRYSSICLRARPQNLLRGSAACCSWLS
jgi:hypothetical protein